MPDVREFFASRQESHEINKPFLKKRYESEL